MISQTDQFHGSYGPFPKLDKKDYYPIQCTLEQNEGVRSMTMCALMFVITISYIASEDRVCGLN